MESQQPARNHRHVLFGLVMAAACWAAVPVDAAVPVPEARIVLNSDRFVVGTKWSLDILVDSPDPLTVKVPLPVLPPNLVLADGPYIRDTSWEKVPGILSRATKVTLTLRAVQPGIVEIGPFDIKVGSSVRTVAPVTVFLLASDEAKRRFPVELGWVKPQGPVYEGQAVPLMLQAKNLDTLSDPPDLSLAPPPGSLWEKAVGLGEIEINSFGEDRLMNIPWGGWMLIPTKAGSLTIPGFQASVTGLTRSVGPLVLDISPLPAEVQGTRAVGDFSYNVDAKEVQTSQGGELVVTQEVSGRGNFPYLILPEVLVPPGLTQVSKQEGTRYRASKGGYEGSLVVTWKFASDQARMVFLTLPGFKSFQPTTGRIDTWDPRTVSVNLTLPSDSTVKAAAARPLDWDGVLAARPWALVHSWWSFSLFLPGFLFLLSTFFLKGKGRGLLVLLSSGILFLSAVDTAPEGFDKALKASGYMAADLWGSLAAANPDEPGLWYNKALACQEAGRTAEAVHGYRMALRTGFQGDLPARGLGALEEKELLTDQFQPWMGWPTNLLLVILCIGVNLAFFLWALQRISGSSLWLVPLTFVVLGSAATGVFLIGAESSRFDADAVVGLSDGAIRKVPGDLAETWMTLKAGTIVRVQGASDRWVLVQTGYGLEGWVQASGLLPLTGGR